VRRPVPAEHDRAPAQALPADEADLYTRSVGLDRDDRGNTGLNEKDRVNPSLGSLDVSVKRHLRGVANAALTSQNRPARALPGAGCVAP
jgi:hypothetical protein